MFSMSEEQKQKCLDLVGRSPEALERDVQSIREWLRQQHHLPQIEMNDQMIQQFLIRNKFKEESAKKALENYIVVRTAIPDFFHNSNPNLPERQMMSKTNILAVLPTLADDLSGVFWIKVTKPNALDFFFLEQQTFNAAELRLREPFLLSEVLVIDVNNIFFEDYSRISPSFLRKGIIIYQKTFKMRLKAIYVINSKKHVSVFIAMVRPFLKSKIMDRIHLDPGIGCLQKFLSKSQIPKDYGGEGPSLETINEMMNTRYLEKKDLFEKLDNLHINDDLRPERLINDEILGYYGNFKKLDVD